MANFKLLLLALLLLGITSKYSTTPKYTFNGLFTSSSPPYLMALSQDSERLGLFSNSSAFYNKQTIFNLDGGSISCSNSTNITLLPLGFPAQTNMLYLDAAMGRIVKMASGCGYPVTVANITVGISAIGIGSTDEESFLALGYNNTIIQYNIGSGGISKSYFLNFGEKIAFLDYSVKRDTLWVGVSSSGIVKYVSFDTSSGSRKNDYIVESSIGFVKGNNDGDGFIGYSTTFGIFYKFDKNGNRNSILVANPNTEIVLGVCTSEDLLISLKAASLYTYSFVAYDSDDGSQVQSFDLGFVPAQFKGSSQIMDCTDKYIAFVDIMGNFQVFDYSHPFPVWAIIVIVVGGVLIIGGAVGFYLWRKKKMQANQNQGYQQFNNQQY